jgi:hypothetical protein
VVLISKKLNSAYGVSLHLNFDLLDNFSTQGVSVLNSVEVANKKTLRFGSWSRACIKLGAPLVRDYFNVKFRLKSDK